MVDALRHVEGVTVHSVSDDTFLMHLGGKLEIQSKVPLKTRADLSMAYTPGVARVCTAIEREPQSSFNLTIRKNCVAVISDGSAVLGLGNIGGAAAMPVMEGKAILFKEFGGVDAFPLCLDTQDPDQIVQFCQAVAPTAASTSKTSPPPGVSISNSASPTYSTSPSSTTINTAPPSSSSPVSSTPSSSLTAAPPTSNSS